MRATCGSSIHFCKIVTAMTKFPLNITSEAGAARHGHVRGGQPAPAGHEVPGARLTYMDVITL